MLRASTLLPLLAPTLVLAACGQSADKGTTITLNSKDGEVRGSADGGTGAVKLDLPGFKGEFRLPKVKLDAENFDLNGVHLYPGSTIETVDVRGDDNDGRVRIAFASPANTNTVRDWFAGRLNKAGFTLRSEGSTLVGTDDENKPFRMELNADGAERAKGTIVLGS